MIDLSLVSDEELSREYWRRAHAARQGGKGGRPKNLKPCPKCGAKMGFNELRAHKPTCTPPTEYLIPAPQATREKTSDQHRVYVTAEGIRLTWSGSMALPALGSVVSLYSPKPHRPYKAEVKGYWMQAGWLGIMTKPKHTPRWMAGHLEECPADAPQWAQDGLSCQTGSEIYISKPSRARRQK